MFSRNSKLLSKFLLLVLIVFLLIIVQRYIYPQKISELETQTVIPTFTEQEVLRTETKTSFALGGAVFDSEGDGIPEIFITGGEGQEDLVLSYRNGILVDITAETNLSSLSATFDVHTLDVDRDGDDDLLIAREDGLFLYVNTKGIFKEHVVSLAMEDKVVIQSLSSADIDNDGFPDIYVSTFIKKSLFKSATFNDPDHLTANIVLRNNHDYTFRDVTESSGLTFSQNTFMSRFVHIDDDSLIDLVVVPNTDRVRIYKNQGDGSFKEMDPLTDYGLWMGIAIGDFDNDNDEDIFLSNAGHSIPKFMLRGDLNDDQPLDVGWKLLRNDGNFIFTDVTRESGVGYDEFAWGAEMADFNNDGYLDLVVLENFSGWLVHKVFKNPGRLLISDTQGHFVATERASGVSNRYFGRVPLVVDINNDSFLDLVYINENGPVRVFFNDGITK